MSPSHSTAWLRSESAKLLGKVTSIFPDGSSGWDVVKWKEYVIGLAFMYVALASTLTPVELAIQTGQKIFIIGFTCCQGGKVGQGFEVEVVKAVEVCHSECQTCNLS